jgi:membrane protein implicated in regulation of membrane protease activity
MVISCIAGWAGLGVVLILVEALFIGGFFLSFSTAAFLVSLFNYVYPVGFVASLVLFSTLGLILVYPWRILLGHLHKDKTNINDY